MKPVTVLLTAIGAPGAPGIIKCLKLNSKKRKIRLIGIDVDLKNAVGVGMIDEAHSAPGGGDQKYIQKVLSLCRKRKVDVIIPLSTRELLPLAENIDLFKKFNISVSVSNPVALSIANNKFELMRYCHTKGLPHPKFELVRSIEDFKTAAKKLGYPNTKICFKPPVSNGLRGFRIIDDSADRMHSLINEKPNNVFIRYREFIEIAKSSSSFPELLVMEFLTGQEYSVDMLMDHGRCLGVIPRSRDKIKMGISFVATTENEKQIANISRSLGEELQLNGNIGLQFIKDEKGVAKIIEINPRVQGTIVLCLASGYDMVYNALRIALGEKPGKFNPRWGVKMVRFWDEQYFYKGKGFRL